MKILWIVHRDLHQDLNISTWTEMTKSLANRNHEITLVVLSTSGKKYYRLLPNLNVKELAVINHFPMVSISFHLQVMILSLYWLFSIRPDVIITHPYTALFLLPANFTVKLLRLKTKYILDIRTLPVSSASVTDKLKNSLNYLSVWFGKTFFNGITVITPALQRIISQQFQMDLHRIGIWMSGVNIDLFQPKLEKSKLHQRFKDLFIVMYHGVFAKNRGLLATVQSMVYVSKQFPDINLFIIGKGSGYKKLVELVEGLNLTQYIHFHESVSYNKIPGFISQADVGIIPLPDELCWRVSSPLKLFEYLAMAKPVIVSSIEAHTFILNNCRAAIFLKSTKPEDIAEGIIKAYSIRKQLPQSGTEGRKFVTENFTWDHQALQLEKFITNL